MADFPKYNATEYPDDWLNNVQTYTLLNGIRNEKEVLKLCKLNIEGTINIPEVSSLGELVKALKAHPTFNIFKSDCRAKIDAMRFEGGDIAKFLADLRKLVNSAEIENPEDVRRRLLNTYASNEFFRNEFAKRVTRTTTIGDMFKIYSDIVSDSSKLIKYVVGDAKDDFEFGQENLIVMKHVATGRYLSSVEVNYETGSQRQIVFAGEKIPNDNCAWYITYEKAPERDPYQAETVLYEDLIYLNHRSTKTTLSLNDYYKSPVTGKAEVHCYAFIASNVHFVKPSQSANNTSYLKMGDTVMIKTENSTYSLSSEGENFTIDDKSYQEVVGSKDNDVKNHEWRIERYRL